MNNIKDSFFIQDLEVFTGIKAHTIRIWEKRYNLLTPTRLNRNIRKYDLLDLQKLLNVSLLYNNGFKISKLSQLSDEQLNEEARKISSESIKGNYYVNSLIVCMYSFDALSFENSYKELISKISFEEIFLEVYIPLLHHIGVLWHTDVIKPAHEHFMSNLICQKILLNTALISNENTLENDVVYVLFLPEGEIHDVGLLYLNLCLKKSGAKTIFLGRSIPFDNLEFVSKEFEKITFVCSFLVGKTEEQKTLFIDRFTNLLAGSENMAYLTGYIWNGYATDSLSANIKLVPKFANLDFL
tara:strand:- start:37146 stop:38039 length:894 start_codon:yes stop_codon:yes gene_type:complete